VDEARGTVDGDVQAALTEGSIPVAQLGQVLHVDVDEANLVVPESSLWLAGLLGGRQAVQAFGLEDAVDGVPVEVRQEVAHHEGEVVEREACGAAQRAHDGAFLIASFPRQLLRPGRAVLAVGGTALAPFADGLGGDAVAARQYP